MPLIMSPRFADNINEDMRLQDYLAQEQSFPIRPPKPPLRNCFVYLSHSFFKDFAPIPLAKTTHSTPSCKVYREDIDCVGLVKKGTCRRGCDCRSRFPSSCAYLGVPRTSANLQGEHQPALPRAMSLYLQPNYPGLLLAAVLGGVPAAGGVHVFPAPGRHPA